MIVLSCIFTQVPSTFGRLSQSILARESLSTETMCDVSEHRLVQQKDDRDREKQRDVDPHPSSVAAQSVFDGGNST